MKPLFPENDGPLFIEQGDTGDCYLLAAVDCIYNSGSEMRNALKSRFQQLEDGSIVVRLKHSEHSKNILSKNLGNKYTYVYDEETKEDVITVSANYVKTIEQDRTNPRRVKTNSLAINILEHVVAYFYHGWDQTLTDATLNSHNIKDRFKGSGPKFVGDLLGFNAHEFTSIDHAIKIKAMDPQAVIYISMQYGKKDKNEKKHEYHSLRIDEIARNGSSHNFILFNPWGNKETVAVEDIHGQHFCIFSKDAFRYKLTKKLMRLDLKLEAYIHKNPQLFNWLLELERQGKIPFVKSYQEDNNILLSQIGNWAKTKEAVFDRLELLRLITIATRQMHSAYPLLDIQNGLVAYLLTENTHHLTPSGSLQSLFIEGILTKDLIKELLSEKQILAIAINTFNNDEKFIHYIQSQKAEMADAALFKIMLAEGTDNTPQTVFNNLYKIHKIHPQMATALFSFAKQHFSKGSNYKPFKQELNDNNDFSQWFKEQDSRDEASLIVDKYVERISQIYIPFDEINNLQEFAVKQQELNQQLEEITVESELVTALQVLGTESSDKITKAVNKQKSDIESKISISIQIIEVKNKRKRAQEISDILDKVEFETHLEKIKHLKDDLAQRAKKYPHNNLIKDASIQANMLYKKLNTAGREFRNSDPSITRYAAFNQFKSTCSNAVAEAMPALEKHRGWKQAFVDILNVIAAISSFGIANLATGRFRLFDVQTESEGVAKKLDKAVNSHFLGG